MKPFRTTARRRHEEVIERLDRIETAQQDSRALDIQEALVDVLRGLQRTLDRLDPGSIE